MDKALIKAKALESESTVAADDVKDGKTETEDELKDDKSTPKQEAKDLSKEEVDEKSTEAKKADKSSMENITKDESVSPVAAEPNSKSGSDDKVDTVDDTKPDPSPAAETIAAPDSATTPAAVDAQNEVSVPQIAELQIMFPSVDPEVIQAVWETTGDGSGRDMTVEQRFDKALSDLLILSDPEYKVSPCLKPRFFLGSHTWLNT